jgi:SprT protein
MGESNGNPELLVLEKLNELRVKARELFTVNIDPTISYDLRGQSAGQANYRHNVIRLNRELLEKYAADFIDQTVPHEFAHLVAYQVYGRRVKPHGNEWRSIMVAFGAEPSRTHRYEVSKTRRLRRYLYKCNCPGKEHELTSIRHNRIRRGAGYLCGQCNEVLRLALGEQYNLQN